MRQKNLQKAILLTAITLCLLTALAVIAGEAEEKRELKLIIDGAEETIQLDGDELAEGESRTLWTENGKRIDVTRTAKGFSLDIDGKTIDLDTDLEGMKLEHGEGRHMVIHRAGGNHDVHMIKVGDSDFDFHFNTQDAAEHLLESGVLDDVDEETRQRILDTLAELEDGEHKVVKKIVHIDSKHEEHEHEHEHEDGHEH